jgi:hypothetical protein
MYAGLKQKKIRFDQLKTFQLAFTVLRLIGVLNSFYFKIEYRKQHTIKGMQIDSLEMLTVPVEMPKEI